MTYLDHDTVSCRAILTTLAAAIAAGCAPRIDATECSRTSRAIQGPYWRANAPFTNDIRRGDGEAIVVRGVVRDAVHADLVKKVAKGEVRFDVTV